MKLVLILFLIALVSEKTSARSQGRIISGKEARTGQFPWQVLVLKTEEVTCGASIISENWVLTAAHCVKGYKKVDLVFGVININDPAGVIMKVTESSYTIHSSYNDKTLENDVALIKLPQPLTFSDTIKAITLNKDPKTFIGETCTISGWGYMSDDDLIHSDNLLFAKVNIIPRIECEKSFEQLPEQTICAKGSNNSNESICNGDSGGALVIDNSGNPLQIGINSFVADEHCTDKLPSGYVQVSAYIDFIATTTKLNL